MEIIQLMQDSYLPNVCGNAISMHKYHLMFKEMGYEDNIFVWGNDRPSYEEYKGVPVYNGRGECKNVVERIKKVKEEKNVKIIVAHSYRDKVISDALKEIDNVFKILIAHFLYNEKRDYNMRDIHDKFDLILCYQNNHVDKYKRMGVPEEKLLYCPPSKDVALFKPSGEINREERSILFVGRVIKSKGVHKILPYLNRLNASLSIVGDTEIDKEYLKELKNEIRKSGVKDKVEFKGIKMGEELIEEYKKHSVFVLLSYSDCFSQVLQECILTGTPAVALENSGSYDWTKGRIFIENNIELVVSRIKTILDGIVDIKYDEKFVKQFDRGHLANKVEKKINELMNKESKKENKKEKQNKTNKFVWTDINI